MKKVVEITQEDRGKNKRDQNATVPGRRIRKQIGVEVHADAEAAGRVKRIPGPLKKLRARLVAAMLMNEALNDDLTSMLLVLRLSGCLGSDWAKRKR